MLLRIAITAGLFGALLTAAEHHGTVKSLGFPIPGATVTATQGETKITSFTDDSGAYAFPALGPGAWTIEVEMMGFSGATMPLTVAEAATELNIDMKVGIAVPKLAVVAVAKKLVAGEPAAKDGEKPLTAEAKPVSPRPVGVAGGGAQRRPGAAGGAAAGRPGGFQRLEVQQTGEAELAAALNNPQQEQQQQDLGQNANESFLVNGSISSGITQTGRMDDAFAAQAEFRDRMAGGGPGGPGGDRGSEGGAFGGGGGGFGGGGGGFGGRGGPGGGGPGGGGPGGRRPGGPGGPDARRGRPPGATTTFGNRGSRGRDGYHGGASYSLRDSAFDAKTYALSGQNIPKASYSQSRISLQAGGMLKIPKLFTDEKSFIFLNYFATRATNPYDNIATVPSALERIGDFSQSNVRGPVTIYDPRTSQPFPGNIIPAARFDPASAGLLKLIPAANQPGVLQNYQIVSQIPTNSDNLSVRLSRTMTKKDRLAGSFSYQRRSGNNLQLFGFTDLSSGHGISSDVTWTHNIKTGLISNLRFNFSRNGSEVTPFFANGIDYASQLNIAGTSKDPRNFGPPNLSFTNFGGLNDGSNSRSHSQTASINEGITYAKGKHTRSFGFEFRRIQTNSVSDSNARGTYSFSGIGTSGFDSAGIPLAASGFDFADYLLGLPQTSSIRFGSADLYMRNSAYNAFVQDDWRFRSNLSFNFGLRYEYLTPLQEKYGRMANLDIAPNFLGVAVVTPATPGPYTGAFPGGLVNPDRNNLAPRASLAYKPRKGKSTLVRLGYGMYYNGSVYNSAANKMAQQPPFAKTFSINTSTAQPLSIQNGFTLVQSKSITNSFAIDRNYRVGYAQTWNVTLQQDLVKSMVLELGYVGTKGTRLDMQRLPNRAAPGSPLTSEQRRLIGNATGFTFDSSDGNSIYHAANIRVSRRFRRGISANFGYTFSKSIDNASSVGGGGGVVVQDDRNFAAERSVSQFNRPHNLTASWTLSTSGTPGSRAARNVWMKDWQLTGGVTVRSGSPFTANVLGNRSDAGGSGAVGSSRADAAGLSIDSGTFFNLAAFIIPPGTRYGNSARNTIIGPTASFVNASFGRTIRFGETRRSIDLRAEANNVFNNVAITSIGTTVNSNNYGLALNAAGMRTMTMNMRFRF